MMRVFFPVAALILTGVACHAGPPVTAKPDAFETLVNPACSHCRDEAKRRDDLVPGDRVLAWTRGYSEGGAIPFRFFLNAYRVISDSYGVFVFDREAGFARGFAPSFEFRFHGWRNGVMVMRHADGTLYSSLTGLAFEGPNAGQRLTPVPTLVSDWGWWLGHYPNAVAYKMFEKYKPVELPPASSADSIASRPKPQGSEEPVLGVWSGRSARAYPVAELERAGFVSESHDGKAVVVLWEPKTRTASAYHPVAAQPRKYKGPKPDAKGVSPPDSGMPLPAGSPALADRTLTIEAGDAPGRFHDAETHSTWDVAGRCVEGELKGWTLAWVDSVQVKSFAWFAEYPGSTTYQPKPPAKNPAKAIAGTAEFLRLLPKPFATIQAVDAARRTVTLKIDGEAQAKSWPLEPDAEVKIGGWWGRLGQFRPGDRAWVWLKLDRQKRPVSVAMIADESSEFDMHASLRRQKGAAKFTPVEVERRRAEQRAWLRVRWLAEGLPGTLTFHHVFSGELEIALDHEAIRWGRALVPGDEVSIRAEPPIRAVVKAVTPWRERTVLRLVVGELESSELKIGQRLTVKVSAPTESVETSPYPPDIGRARTEAERVEWFLASIYCTCGVSKDVCTGHFYTQASCNPNGCGMPNARRKEVAEMIARGMTDREIFEELLKDAGPLLTRPHLKP